MVRLADYGPRRPAQLSGGQRQRVALARALVGRPRVLLLDEPLGALDLKLREQMQVELKAIQREVGITFVIVTHDQDEALTLCDRLAVFNDGRIEQVGKARDVYENPANRFVADFVGTSNVLDGDARRGAGRPGGHVRRAARTHRGAARRAAAPCPAVRTVDATVAEVIYAGPDHAGRGRRRRQPGVTLDRHRAHRQPPGYRRTCATAPRSRWRGPTEPYTISPTDQNSKGGAHETHRVRIGLVHRRMRRPDRRRVRARESGGGAAGEPPAQDGTARARSATARAS